MVYRNYLGNTQFSAIVNQKIAKLKQTDENGKVRAKVAVAVKDPETGKYDQEFIQIRFFTEADREVFSKIFKETAGI